MNKNTRESIGWTLFVLIFLYGVVSLGKAILNTQPHDAHVKCMSNGAVVYDGQSDGRIRTKNNSYSFTELGSGNSIMVPTQQCVLTYNSKTE